MKPPRVLLLLSPLAMLNGCAGVPSTHMLIPSPDTVPQMQRLATRAGALAVAITTDGEEKALVVEVDPHPGVGQPGALVGKSLDDYYVADLSTRPADTVLPFDYLALIYYTNPGGRGLSWWDKLPRKDRFPTVSAVGKVEQALPCEALNVELARAGALRGFLGVHATMPLTKAHQFAIGARHATADVLGVVFATATIVSLGGTASLMMIPAILDSGPDPTSESNRPAVTALGTRLEGLRRLEQRKQCGVPQPPPAPAQ